MKGLRDRIHSVLGSLKPSYKKSTTPQMQKKNSPSPFFPEQLRSGIGKGAVTVICLTDNLLFSTVKTCHNPFCLWLCCQSDEQVRPLPLPRQFGGEQKEETMLTFSVTGGDHLPALGLGTWKSAPGAVYTAVKEALAIGYRHIDCAPIYQNEPEVGRAIIEAIDAGTVARADLWLTSKLWNNAHAPDQVRPALEKTLTDLRIDSLDLYLIHWPVAFRPGVLFARTSEDYVTLAQTPIIETWKAMEACVAEGLTRHIGVCNFSVAKLDALCRQAAIPPAMNQIELHPYLQQEGMLDFCRKNGVLVTAYAPLGSGDRPAAMKKSDEPTLLDNPVIQRVAAKHGAPPAQVLLAWGLGRKTVVIPKSVNPERLRQNLAAAHLVLDAQDRADIAALDRGYRFVDGSFFTGPGSPYTLKDLWDE
jgi:alcohol dehydrogenase (NADP+)